ncbi:MAG TPA: hypothetical protein VHO66_10055 [Ruminiclostridium sp.]|nr:hypothetical protein [Ruminiclostridium sp.]
MQEIAICLVLYSVLIIFDIIPQIKSKRWKPLWFVFLIYFTTFVLEALLALGIIKSRLNEIIITVISFIFRLK